VDCPITRTKAGFLALCLCTTATSQALPLIVTQPVNQTNVDVGKSYDLTVVATGIAPLRYQWRCNGVNIPGETNAVLTFKKVATTNGGSYTVAVGDATGTVTSQAAKILLNLADLPFVDDFNSLTNFVLADRKEGNGRGSNASATKEVQEPKPLGKPTRNSVWLRWRPLYSGIATITTSGSDFDTVLAVYTGTNINNLTEVAANDDGGGFLTSLVKFNAEVGTDCLIYVAGFGNARGDIVLNWDLDTTKGKIAKITKQPQAKSAKKGTAVALSFDFTSDALMLVQWYRNDQPVLDAVANILNLASLTNSSLGTYVARIWNPLTGAEILTEPVSIQIHDEGSAPGDVLAMDKLGDLNATGAAQAQKASVPSSRRRLSLARGYSGSQVFNTFGATSEEGEPKACGAGGGASAWYAYQAETNGLMTVDTQGSDFDTVLAVYTGDGASYATLQEVTCNNDFGTNNWSKVSFLATGGTIYYIQVDGINGATGTAQLNYNLDPPPSISVIADQTTNEEMPSTIPFTIGDVGTAVSNLVVTCSSTNVILAPANNIIVSGSASNRTVTITPVTNQFGTTLVTVNVSDAWTNTTRSFVLTVNPVNDAPTGRNSSAQRAPNDSLKLSVSKLVRFFRDVDGDVLSISSVSATSVNGASVRLSSRGDWILYFPPSGFNDSDTFDYTVTDGHGGSASATVTINVLPPTYTEGPNSISVTPLDNGEMLVRFLGIPSRTYTIQATTNLAAPSWANIGTSLAGSNGAYEFIDTQAGNFQSRYYRSVWP
jgi:hypothetical protein